MDVLTKEQRHKAMSHIHSKDTSIEMKLRRALWKKGYRYRKNYSELPGSPDIALTKYKIAIFCDSEFFHGKDWELVLKPRLLKSKNSEYWIKKILRNMERDAEVDKKLLFLGWTVIHFWGSDITKKVDECVRVIEECIFDIQLQSDSLEMDIAETDFEEAHFAETHFEETHFEETHFEEVDFEEIDFEEARFEEARFGETDFEKQILKK